jgi:hypothetical protein
VKRAVSLVGIAAIAFAATALPAFGADSGTVAATVTAESTCITVTPANAPLGTLPFSAAGRTSSASITPTIASCTSASQKLFARGTAATGTGATWHLSSADVCMGTLNRYRVNPVSGFSTGSGMFIPPLSVSDQRVADLGANQTLVGLLHVEMPCTGSDGAGTEMSFSIIFTATL